MTTPAHPRPGKEVATVRTPARLGVLRYMGNKLALLDDVVEEVAAMAPAGSLVVDPMAGSHAVTYALKATHRLLAADVQAYSAVVGRAFVDNVTVPRLSEADRARLLDAGRRRLEDPRVGFLEASYADTYLGASQCRQLDALRGAVDDVFPTPPDAGGGGGDPRRWLALASLLTAACRAQASPGHFAQFLPPDHPRTLTLRGVDLFAVVEELLGSWRVEPGLAGSRTVVSAWAELPDAAGEPLEQAACWYLDPPYTRDQYSRFYHFLETLALGDRPSLRFKARYRDDRFKSAFCSGPRAAAELRALLAAVRAWSPAASVVLSYSSRGILGADALIDAAAGLFELAGSREIPHVYSTQGKGNLAGVVEWLLTFSPST